MSRFDDMSGQGATNLYPWFWGAYWLGPNTPPPLPAFFGMTDRFDGTVWYLILNAVGDHLQITSTAPTSAPIKVYAPYDGPFIGQNGFRLGVRASHLVVDTYPYSGAGPFARQLGAQTFIAGVYVSDAQGKQSASLLRAPHLSFAQGTIRSVHTPTEPQIAPVVVYNTYYTELQDSGNLP